MTTIGKLLVFLNLFAGVGVLAWALSVYSNRVDWLDAKTEEGGVQKGQISQMKDEITELTQAIASGNGAYGFRRDVLLQTEAVRDYRRRAFGVVLAQAEGGKFFTLRDDPRDSSLTDVDATLRDAKPVTYGDPPRELPGVKVSQDKLQKLVTQMNTLVAGTNFKDADVDAVAAEAGTPQFNALLNDPARLPGIPQVRAVLGKVSERVEVVELNIDRQKVLRLGLLDEQKYIQSNRIEWVARLQTLERRKKQLTDALKAYGTPAKVGAE